MRVQKKKDKDFVLTDGWCCLPTFGAGRTFRFPFSQKLPFFLKAVEFRYAIWCYRYCDRMNGRGRRQKRKITGEKFCNPDCAPTPNSYAPCFVPRRKKRTNPPKANDKSLRK